MEIEKSSYVPWEASTYGLWGLVLLVGGWLFRSLNINYKAEIGSVKDAVASLQDVVEKDQKARQKEREKDKEYMKEILELSLKPIIRDINEIKNDKAAAR